MANRREFGEGPLFTATNYIWWFLLTNIYFLLMNILFIFVWLVSFQVGQGLNLFLVISILPAGPALAALFSVMGKLVREKDVDVTKDFFKAYKKNFWEALFFWGVIIGILTVIYIDTMIIKVELKLPLLSMILLVLGFIVVSMSLYILPLISRFYLKVKDIIRLAFMYMIKKIHVTIANWIILFVLFYLLSKISMLFLFMWSIFAYAVMYLENDILKELEEKLISQNKNNSMEQL